MTMRLFKVLLLLVTASAVTAQSRPPPSTTGAPPPSPPPPKSSSPFGAPNFANLIYHDHRQSPYVMPPRGADLLYTDRTYPEPRCKTCQRLVADVRHGTAPAATNTNRTNASIAIWNTQVWMTQNDVVNHLGFDAGSWEDVRVFLVRGGLLSDSGVTATVASNVDASEFCERVRLCGKNATRFTDEAEGGDFNTGAVIVRFKLRLADFSPFKIRSPSFKGFVSLLLHEVAEVTDEPARRFEFHVHPDDDMVEVIVLRDEALRKAAVVASELKRMVDELDHPLMHARNRILSMIDHTYVAQMFALNIPTSDVQRRNPSAVKPWGKPFTLDD